jgi:Mg/Co/Ni transporter MgtE
MQDKLLEELENVDHTAIIAREGDPDMEAGKIMARNFVRIATDKTSP